MIKPNIHPTCYIDETAVIIGNVIIEKNCSVWPHAVIRGDRNKIVIRENTNIQDGCIIHTDDRHEVEIGRNVSLGHGAIVHGAKIGDNTLIGMHATVLSGVKIGRGCLIGANALVLEDVEIPDYSLVVGVPGRILRQDKEMEKEITKNADTYRILAKQHMEKRFFRFP